MKLMENKVKPSCGDLLMTIGMKLGILISFGATKCQSQVWKFSWNC